MSTVVTKKLPATVPFRKLGKTVLRSAALVVYSTSVLQAQDAASSNEQVLFGSADAPLTAKEFLGLLDLNAPTEPLFTLTKSSPETVITPKTGEELAFSILPQAVDALGNEQFSLGININPGMMMLGDRIPVDQLASEQLNRERRWARVNISGSAIRTNGETGFSQYGLGVSYLYDAKSPLEGFDDYASCLARDDALVRQAADARRARGRVIDTELRDGGLGPTVEYQQALMSIEGLLVENAEPDAGTILEVMQNAGVQGDLEQRTRRILTAHRATFVGGVSLSTLSDRASESCRLAVTKWNRPVIGAGLATYYSDPAGGDSETGYGLWFSASREVGENGQVIGSARLTEGLVRNRHDGDATITETVDGWGLGLRYVHQLSAPNRLGANAGSTTRGFIEAGYFQEEFSGIDDEFWQAGLGAEIAVGNGTYLQFIVGDTWESEVDRAGYLSAQVKWALVTNRPR